MSGLWRWLIEAHFGIGGVCFFALALPPLIVPDAYSTKDRRTTARLAIYALLFGGAGVTLWLLARLWRLAEFPVPGRGGRRIPRARARINEE